MDSLGVKVLDSSIAAELFMYYNPGLYMSGYQSSTFQNAGEPENDCGLFNVRKADAISNPTLGYAPNMDFFIITVGKLKPDESVRDAAIKALIGESTDDLFLVELSDAIIEKTGESIAIYNDTTGKTTYYSEMEGTFTQTRVVG